MSLIDLKEQQRLQEMRKIEDGLYAQGYKVVCGVDEVGRGPLAGPVVSCAVVLPPGFCVCGANDSKKLTQKRREELFVVIKDSALCYGFGIVSQKIIDDINILQATKLSMKQAVESLEIQGLKITPEYALIDGRDTIDIGCEQSAIVRGDEKCLSVACASILAKVYRDELMRNYSKEYPEYGFEKHKGYGTKAHIAAILEHGPCEIHRRSFLKKILR